LASSGETTAPCGVPTFDSDHCPSYARLEPFLDQADDALIADPVFHEPNEPFLAYGVEERLDVGVQDVFHLPAFERDHERIECVVRAAAGPESVAEPEEVFLVDGIQHRCRGPLDDLVLQRCDRERALPPIRLGNVYAP